MNKTILLEKIKRLNENINYFYGIHYNNFVLQNLYDKDIYNSIINFHGKTYLSLKKLKRYYIQNKIELVYGLENNNKIIDFSKSFGNYINNNLF